MNPVNTAQRLLDLLPAIYREDSFLGQYLWAFEQLLLDLERQIDAIPTLFDAQQTRADFLPWLSSWTAFALRADLNESQQRAFLGNVIPLYRRRGTARNLQQLLEIFTRGTPTVSESPGQSHHFRVTVRLPVAPPEVQLRQSAIAHALIELEKPAHTGYDLEFVFPSMQLGVTSTVGVDTLLGTGPGT